MLPFNQVRESDDAPLHVHRRQGDFDFGNVSALYQLDMCALASVIEMQTDRVRAQVPGNEFRQDVSFRPQHEELRAGNCSRQIEVVDGSRIASPSRRNQNIARPQKHIGTDRFSGTDLNDAFRSDPSLPRNIADSDEADWTTQNRAGCVPAAECHASSNRSDGIDLQHDLVTMQYYDLCGVNKYLSQYLLYCS